MKCARCSAEVPSQSQFCLRCGTPINAAGATGMNPAAPRPVVPAPEKNNTPLIATITVLSILVLGLLAFVVKGMLAQKPAEEPPTGLVQAPKKQAPSGLVEKPAESKPVEVVQKPAEGTPPPPAEIVNYLAFVKQIEAEKQTLLRKQDGEVLALLPQVQGLSASTDGGNFKNAFDSMSKTMNGIVNDFNALSGKFQRMAPPQSCLALHDRYYDHLGKVQAEILAVSNALGKIGGDSSGALKDLTEIQGKASSDIDTSIRDADNALSDICDKYKIRKDFDIRGDSAGSSMVR